MMATMESHTGADRNKYIPTETAENLKNWRNTYFLNLMKYKGCYWDLSLLDCQKFVGYNTPSTLKSAPLVTNFKVPMKGFLDNART